MGLMGCMLLSLSVAACSRSKPAEPKAASSGAEAADAPVDPVEHPVEAAVETATTEATAAAKAPENTLKAALLGLERKDNAAAEPTEPMAPKRRPVRRRSVTTDATAQAAVVPVGPPTLSDYDFQSAVNAWRGMRTCLAKSSLRGTDRNGAMKIAFRIRGDGSVADAQVVETSNEVASAIAPCVQESARRIRFLAFGGKDVEKEAKFVF